MRWRIRVQGALEHSGLTFTQWLVLAAADDLIRSTDDAVNQNDIAAHASLDRRTVSRVVIGLEDLGLVDRGPDATNSCWRLFLTTKAQALLGRLRVPLY